MAGFDDPAFYGDRWAGVYDEHHAGMDPAPAVEFLAGLSGDGLVLELAIGTGRVAPPLAGRGIAVEGIDASEAMVARLRAKPGGESIPVVIGDMAQVPASGPFRLVYLVSHPHRRRVRRRRKPCSVRWPRWSQTHRPATRTARMRDDALLASALCARCCPPPTASPDEGPATIATLP